MSQPRTSLCVRSSAPDWVGVIWFGIDTRWARRRQCRRLRRGREHTVELRRRLGDLAECEEAVDGAQLPGDRATGDGSALACLPFGCFLTRAEAQKASLYVETVVQAASRLRPIKPAILERLLGTGREATEE
jgi:hypothetical protein